MAAGIVRSFATVAAALYFAATALGPVAAQSDPSGAPASSQEPMSRIECVAAHAAALNDMMICIDKGRTDAFEKSMQSLGEAHRAFCDPNSEDLNPMMCGLLTLTLTQGLDILQADFDRLGGMEEEWRKCMATFQTTTNGLEKSCAVLGAGGNRSMTCSARRVIASSCAAHCNNLCTCGKWFPVGGCTQGNTAPIVLENIGCGFVRTDAQQCRAQCGGNTTCVGDCSARENQMIASCLGFPPSAATPGAKPGGRVNDGRDVQRVINPAAQQKPTRTKTQKLQVGTDGPKQDQKARINLDKFDLGPSFASPGVPATRSGVRTRTGSPTIGTAAPPKPGATQTQSLGVPQPVGGVSVSAPPAIK